MDDVDLEIAAVRARISDLQKELAVLERLKHRRSLHGHIAFRTRRRDTIDRVVAEQRILAILGYADGPMTSKQISEELNRSGSAVHFSTVRSHLVRLKAARALGSDGRKPAKWFIE